MIDYQVKLDNVGDLEEFANTIKDAVIDVCRSSERFSAIRLTNTHLRYDDFMRHGNARGVAYENDIVVRQTESALQLAGTVVHEMGHAMVGARAQHSQDWFDATRHLGMAHVQSGGQMYQPEHFQPWLLDVITKTLERLRIAKPQMVYDPDMVIPWPTRVGDPTCPCLECNAKGQCEVCGHTIGHVMPFQIANNRAMLANPKNILLADEMGLGKTVTVMGYINAALKPESRILVVCPNNIKLVWKRHFDEWCIHKYPVEIAYTQLYLFSNVVVMNYEAATKWAPALAQQKWDLVVFDEMHYLKTPSTKRAKACYRIRGDKAIGLTGTPIPNYVDEVFPLLHYLDREQWPEFGAFQGSYMVSGSRFGRNLNRLNARLRATIMLRSLKKDVLTDLPRKRRQVIELETPTETKALIETEKKLFNSLHNDGYDATKLINQLRNESDVVGDDFDWAALIEALQTTKRFAFEEMARIAHLIGLAKVPHVIEHVEQVLENREKIAVFGHHRDVLTKISEAFPGSALLLGGHANQGDLTRIATEKFANDDSCRVFVSGIHLAQGYSLAAGSTTLFCEEDWVPGLMTQAEDRMHGIARGSTDARSLLIQHLVFEDSLDTIKAKLAIKKQKAIERAVNKQTT